MGDQATSTSGGAEQQAQQASDAPVDKGKGRAVEDVDMDEEDDSSDEESGAEEQVDEPEDDDADNMEEIDTDNIRQGRTRGVTIDFQKAAEEAGPEDDEDEEDEDFEAPDAEMED